MKIRVVILFVTICESVWAVGPVSPKKPSVPTPPAAAPARPAVNVAKLADAIQKKYDSTKTATFDFEQIYQHRFLTVMENSKGTVAYEKAPGNMVWQYNEPTNRQKKFFIKGRSFTYYSISDKIAYTHNCYDKDTLSASVTFLLGTGNLKTSFTITALTTPPPNNALSWLALTPKEKNAPITKILLGVNAQSQVMESLVEDPSGGKNHFKFSNFKTNPKIAEGIFVFNAPPGVVVQPMPNVSCAEPAAPPRPSTPSPKAPPTKSATEPKTPARPAKPAPKTPPAPSTKAPSKQE